MIDEPAIRKVVKALQQRIIPIPQVHVFIDRSRVDAVGEDERPAIVIRVSDMSFDQDGQGETVHTAAIELDIYEESLTFESITARHMAIIRDVIEAVHSDRTLGGLMQSFEERGATSDEDEVPDLGCAVLTFEAQFRTPRGDFSTILGASGPL
jgi:hypothetical protein